MGQVRHVLTPHRSPLHRWGAQLRTLRDRHGLSLATLGAEIFYDPSHLGKFERAERTPPRHVAAACDQRLGGSGVLVRLWESIHDADASRDEANRSGYEAKSRPHEASTEPNLATVAEDRPPWEDGAVSLPVLHDGKVIVVSISRRTLLSVTGISAVVTAAGTGHETAAAEAADPSMAAAPDATPIEYLQQIRRVLIDTDNLFGPRAAIPTVEQQIRLMQRLRGTIAGADHRCLIQLQATYAEFAGWLHQDAGTLRAARYWTDRALEWSHASHDPDLIAYILARKAQLAGDLGDPVQALDMGQAAQDAARPDTRLAAIAATYTAHGHALQRNAATCAAAYDKAHHLIDTTDADPASPWGTWLDHAYIDVHHARSLTVMGRQDQAGATTNGSDRSIRLSRRAADTFATAIDRLPVAYHRDRGVYLARQAAAYTGANEPEQAAAVANRALAIGTQTASARILTELAQVDRDLTPWRSIESVAAFHNALADSTR